MHADGTLTAVDARTDIDGGAYSSIGLVTTYYSGQLLTIPSFAPNYRFRSTRYFTNKPPCGPKRGHGSVQPRFAFESMLDRLAERLAIDPIELRRKNAVPAEGFTVNGMRVTSNGYLECLALQDGARLVLTDSGGIQEETTVLGVPCLALRSKAWALAMDASAVSRS